MLTAHISPSFPCDLPGYRVGDLGIAYQLNKGHYLNNIDQPFIPQEASPKLEMPKGNSHMGVTNVILIEFCNLIDKSFKPKLCIRA